MAYSSVHHLADANEQVDTVQQSRHASTDGPSCKEDPEMRRFAAVLAQLRHKNMASLVSSIRQGKEDPGHKSSSSLTMAAAIGCKILPKPLYGSYHLAYRVMFEDGVEWILKVPANGHHACFDHLAADALTSEALTMRMIKQTTTIPIPTIHHFDASADNEIGCPFILMDFLKGKPVWQGWFDKEASSSALEQFRARSLQTIAAAMVQLSRFTLDRGGSLRFDSHGRPVDVASAKVPDSVAEQDAMQGLTTLGEDCPYCEKGPTTDPASSFTFMLDRRGSRENDGAYDRGICQAMRLFTQWTLEKAETTEENGQQFVLAHPDFAFQNILVEDDGTLCGIIDWDGVAAVPLSVGSLKYPDWLMSDWHPWNDYSPGNAPQQDNSLEELAIYRVMYAQFVESYSSVACGSSKAGKLKADITRMSLVAGSLHLAANDLQLTDDMAGIIFEHLEALTAEDDDSDESDSVSGSSVGTDTEDTEEEDSDTDISSTESEDTSGGDEESDIECLCSKCIAELAPDQPPPHKVDAENGTAGDKEAVASRKAKVAKWALGLGEKGCREVSKVFHKEIASKPQPTRKAKIAKWALGLGEKGCKRASKAFHKKEEALKLQPKDLAEAMPAQKISQTDSKTSKAAICLLKRSESLLRKIIARLHRVIVPGADRSDLKGTKTHWVQMSIKWLVDLLKKMIRKPVKNDINGEQPPTAAGGQLPANVVLVDTERCQRCNPGEQNTGDNSTKIDSEDIWSCIAAEIDKAGIPIDRIKKRQDVIAQFVIQNLRKEMEREKEKEKELYLKNEKSARKAKKARKQAEVAKANHGSNPDCIQRTDFIESEDTACPDSVIVYPEDNNWNEVNPDHIRPYDDECGPEPESLISKLEAAKQRFDMEMVLKGRSSWSASLGPGNAGSAITQLGDFKPQESAHDVTTEDATEEANRKLRMVLASFAKPKADDAHLKSNVSHISEESGAVTEQPGYANSGMSDTMSSEDIELANQKLRTVLSNFQKQNIPTVTEVEYGPESREGSQTSSVTCLSDTSSKNVAAQFETAVKVGRWFETPRGSLRRIEHEEKLYDRLDDQESISQPDSCFSGNKGGSSKTSVASRGDEDLTKVSDFQLIFPNYNKAEAINIFHVPDIDEDEEEYEMVEFPKNDDSGDYDQVEDDEIVEETLSSVDDELNGEGEELRTEEVDLAESASKPKEGEIVDSGYFTIGEICVALGNGNLDEQRMTRLKEGFMALLDDTVGRYKR